MRRSQADHPAVITNLPVSGDDGYDYRKKKYAIMMATRALCVILAATFYHVSIIIAVAFAVAGVILPWCAVLIANDRPAKKRQAALGTVARGHERAIPAGTDDRTVDG